MKKSWKSLTALLAASLLCLGMFAGCSEAEESSSSESSSESSSSTSTSSSSSSEEEEAAEDVVGEITYLGTSSLVVDVYEVDSEITDYTDLEGIALTGSGDSETVTLEDDAVYQSVSSGVASDITLDDLAEGDMVAVTTDEDGVQTIIVLEVETAMPSWNPLWRRLPVRRMPARNKKGGRAAKRAFGARSLLAYNLKSQERNTP